MSSYGEPWKLEQTGRITDAIRRPLADTRYAAQRGERIVACVNALAGRDPEALAELEAAVDEVLELDDISSQIRLMKALAAFRQPPIAPVKDGQDATDA